ncbi:MAG: hypothetical protein UHM08_06445 [Bacteroidales bacterium]|nr:hypothetical protein [Bacteroidales bacterium]
MARYKYDIEPNQFVEEMYKENYTTKTNNFCIGKSVVTLMLLSTSIPTQAMVDNFDLEDTQTIYMQENSLSTSYKSVDINNFQLKVIRSLSYNRSNINYEHFLAQFEENITDISDRFSFKPLFNYLAHGLEQLKIEKSYIDVSKTKRLMEFHLNLGKGIYVSVLKDMGSLNENLIEYTISVNNELKSASIMPIEELQEKLIFIQKSLNIV